MNDYDKNLDKNKANYIPLTPISFIERTKDIINDGPYWNTQIAIDKELVDGSKYPDEFNAYIKKLQSKGFQIIAADLYTHNSIENFKLDTNKWALVLGSEAHGLSESVSD